MAEPRCRLSETLEEEPWPECGLSMRRCSCSRRRASRCAFGVPGAAINPLYSALRARGGIRHILARHVEGASHMAEGYTRAAAGNIGVCIGTSGPAGTDMITGLYSASAEFDPDPVHHRPGAARAAHKEDFQAVDIASIAQAGDQMGGDRAWSPRRCRWRFQQAFHLMRSGRPGPVLIDLPIDVQTGRDRVRHRHLRAAAGLQAGDHAGRRSRRRWPC